MKIFFKYLVIPLLLFSDLNAQYNGNDFAISSSFSYNTTANIFLTPDAETILARTNSFEIEGIYSYSFEFRYRLSEIIILGISAEYMEGSGKGRNIEPKKYIVEDGFELIPIEFSIYYFLPFSTEKFKFYMGGGFGLYTGRRTRRLGNVKFKDIESDLGYGIQISAGMDYMIFDNFSVRGEFRFRDPDFRITNKYNAENGIYDGVMITLPQENITSKLNLDGITFRIGAVFHFSNNN